MKRLVACALTCIVFLATFAGLSIAPANAVDACAGYDPFSNPGFEAETPNWKVLSGPKMIFQVTWTFTDKNSCITGPSSERGPRLIKAGTTALPETSWQLGRRSDGFSLVRATFEVPMSWFEFSNFNRTGGEAIKFQFVDIKHNGRPLAGYTYGLTALRGTFDWDDLWAIYFSKKQGIYTENCDVIKSEKPYGATAKYLPDFTYRVDNPGKNPTLNVDIADTRQCIHLVGVLPVTKDEYARDLFSDFPLMFDIERYYAHYSFWDIMSYKYAPLFENNQIPKLRIAQGDFARTTSVTRTLESDPELHEILSPISEFNHTDNVIRNSTKVTISSKLDLSTIDISKLTPDSITGVYVGYYYPYSGTLGCSPSRVTVTGSGPTTKLNYNAGSCLDPAQKYQYQTKYIQIPTLDLLYGVGKADSERKVIALAVAAKVEAKIAEELKAKQEAEAKAAAELKASQDRAGLERKAKQEAADKEAAELKAREEFAKVAAEQKLTSDIIELEYKIDELGRKFPSQKSILEKYVQSLSLWSDSQFRITSFAEMLKESNRIRTEINVLEVKWNKSKKTISCVKGSKTIKITDVKPKCPSGYRAK